MPVKPQFSKLILGALSTKKNAAEFSAITFQAGNLLECVFAASGNLDIYFLSTVPHGFSDEDCVRALCNINSSAGDSDARIAIMDFVLSNTIIARVLFRFRRFPASNQRSVVDLFRPKAVRKNLPNEKSIIRRRSFRG